MKINKLVTEGQVLNEKMKRSQKFHFFDIFLSHGKVNLKKILFRREVKKLFHQNVKNL